MIFQAGTFSTPLGTMVAVLNTGGGLVRLDFGELDSDASEWHGLAVRRDQGAVAPVAGQLSEYFSGNRRIFDLPLAPIGNPFLREAWDRLAEVPYGSTVTYGELAKRLAKPTSARAMGRANAVNPISIIVPCHRVIGADGTLTGYGGGLERKAALLRLESAPVQASLFTAC